MKRLILPLALVAVACDSSTGPAATYTVGGQASGVIGSGCVLQVNGANNLSITGNGFFTFPATFLNHEAYVARVFNHPIGPDQTCSLTDSSGTVNGANVANIGVSCTVDRPPCADYFNAGSMAGDVGSGVLTDSWHGEGWTRVQLTEQNASTVYLSATVTLTVPAGIDYDLYLYCASCGTTAVASSTSGTGVLEVVQVRWDDDLGQTDDGQFFVQVRYFSGSSPNNWTLQIQGNTAVSTVTCDF